MKGTTALATIAGLALWYTINSGPSIKDTAEKRYPLKPKMQVEHADYVSKSGLEVSIDNSLKPNNSHQLDVNDVDFSEHFTIKTDRYNLVKDDDWWISQKIGVIGSLPSKLFFWDWDIGRGEDDQTTRSVLAMLEYNKDVKNITVRLNHNRVWKDLGRLFIDDKVTKRNGFLARVLMGVPTILSGELLAELTRSDYYNSMTQTVVTYSNLESIAGHEIGHHRDFQRFDRDWIYSLTRLLPPVMLYQEWTASKISDKMLAEQDSNQFNRYLIPAFLTYCFAAYGAMRKYKKAYEKFIDSR